MSDITNIAVSAGNVVPVDTLGGQVTVKVNSGGPVYYADNAQVSSANNQGSITAGNSVTFSAPQFITGAAGVQASVTLTLFAGSSTAPGAPKDVVLGSDGLVGGPGGTGLTTSAAIVSSANTFTQPQHIAVASNPNNSDFDIGDGGQYGAPPSAPTVSLGGAGALTGAYKYAYSESDYYGETPLSPVSSIVNPAGNVVLVTLPSARRGTSTRNLYRTVAGGSTYFLVGSLTTGGSNYFVTAFSDNTPDGSLGKAPSVSDGTRFKQVNVANHNVTYFRNFPTDPGLADLGILTADPSTVGALAIDCYGEILVRSRASSNLATEKVGPIPSDGSRQIRCTFLNSATAQDTQTLPTFVDVFYVDGPGNVKIAPQADSPVIAITQLAGATSAILTSQQSGDSALRFQMTTGASMSWGPGNASLDTTLARTGVGRLQVSNALDVSTVLNVGAGAVGSSANTLSIASTGANDVNLKLFTASWGALQLFAKSTSPGQCSLMTTNATPLGLGTSSKFGIQIDTNQNVIAGTGALATPAELATNATNGFFYIPTVNGTPSGTPASLPTGAAPIVIDRAGSKLWLYVGGSWKGVVIA